MMRLLLGFVVMLMTMTNAHANNASCQAGTGINTGGAGLYNGTPSKTNGFCIECESYYPLSGSVSDLMYNLQPNSSLTSGGVCNTSAHQYYELTAHIAGYSGDGIHNAAASVLNGNCTGPGTPWTCCTQAGQGTGKGNCDIQPDLTLGGTASCTGDSTHYPSINTNGANFNSYDQTNYPPMELGYYTNPAPSPSECSKADGVGPNCARWSQWSLINDSRNGTYSELATNCTESSPVSQEDYDREDIGYPCFVSGGSAEDAATGTAGNDDDNNLPQAQFLCSVNGTHSAVNWHGDTVYPRSDLLPLLLSYPLGTFPWTVIAPAQLYCSMTFGDATISSSTWSPSVNADASGDYPIQVDVSFQTNSTGSHELDDQWLADLYITHDGGHKGWPLCIVEYDTRLNPE